MRSFLDLCVWCKAQYDPCYYSGSNISSCAGNGVHEIWMRGRRATPKQRLVCGPCLAWVTRDVLADLIEDTNPTDNHGLTGHGCAADVGSVSIEEVRSQL